MKYVGSFCDPLGLESRVEIERLGVEGVDREIVFTEFGVQLFRDGLDLWDPIYSQGCEIGVWIEHEGWYEDLFFGVDIWGVRVRVWRGDELVFAGRGDGDLMNMELRVVPRELIISCVDGLGDLEGTTADIGWVDGMARIGEVVLSCLRCIEMPFNLRLNSDLYLDIGDGFAPVMDALIRREAFDDDQDEYGRMRVARDVLRDVLTSFGLRLSWGRGVWRLDRLRNVVDRVWDSEYEYDFASGALSSVVGSIREVCFGRLDRNSFVRRPRVGIDSGYGRMRVNWDPRLDTVLALGEDSGVGVFSDGNLSFFGPSLLPQLAKKRYTTISYYPTEMLSCNVFGDLIVFDLLADVNKLSYIRSGIGWRFRVNGIAGRYVMIEMDWGADNVGYFSKNFPKPNESQVTFMASICRSDGLWLEYSGGDDGVYRWVEGGRKMLLSVCFGNMNVTGKFSLKMPIDEGSNYDYAMVVYPGTVFTWDGTFFLTGRSFFNPEYRSNYRIWNLSVRVVDDVKMEVSNSFVAEFPIGYPRNAPVLNQRLMTTTGDVNIVNTLLKDRWTEIGGVIDIGLLNNGAMSLLEWMIDDRMAVWKNPRRVVECEVAMDDLVLSGDRVRIEGEDGVYVVLGYRHFLLGGESRVSVMEIK